MLFNERVKFCSMNEFRNFVVRNLVGGRVRAILSGGAPLAPDTHDYLKTVLCCPILQVRP